MSSLDKIVSSKKKKLSPDLLTSPKIFDKLSPKSRAVVYNTVMNGWLAKGKKRTFFMNGVEVIERAGRKGEDFGTTAYKMSHKFQFVENPNAKDISFSKLRKFLLANNVMINTWRGKAHWVKDEYMCSDFTMALHNNAISSGIRCALVGVIYRNSPSHALVAFNTTDHGLVFVDPTNGYVLSKKNYLYQCNPYKSDFVDAKRGERFTNSSPYIEMIRNNFIESGEIHFMVIDW
jgi:hypothetical protein